MLWRECQGSKAPGEEDKLMELLEPTEILGPGEIPEPEETGSSGTQTTAVVEIVPIAEEPLKGLPIAQRLEGLYAASPRLFGGELAGSLILGFLHQYEQNNQTLRKEIEESRKELKQTTEELSGLKTRAAVLQERVNTYKREKLLKNLSITVGTALISIGIEFIRGNIDSYGYIIGVLGLLLLFFGWFSKSEEAGE